MKMGGPGCGSGPDAETKIFVQRCAQVFLGGSCNPTSWRQDIAIPLFSRNSISFYNPQRPGWNPQMIEIEDQAKQGADVLLFVVDNKTRSTSSMVEAAYLTGCDCSVFLVVKAFEGPGIELQGERMSKCEFDHLTKAQLYLTDIVQRQGFPVFNDITTSIHCSIELLNLIKVLKDMRVQDSTLADGAESVKFGHFKLGDRFFGAGEVFQFYDPQRTGSISVKDLCIAFKSITKAELDDSAIANFKPTHPNRKGAAFFNFDEFCCILKSFRNGAPPPPTPPTPPTPGQPTAQKSRWWHFRRFLLRKLTSWYLPCFSTASASTSSSPPISSPSSPSNNPSFGGCTLPLPSSSSSFLSPLSAPSVLPEESGIVTNESSSSQQLTHSLATPVSFSSSTSGISLGTSPSFSSCLPSHVQHNSSLLSSPPMHSPPLTTHAFSSSSREYDIFLGGPIRDSSWRENIAIPELKKKGISYYHPKKSLGGEGEDGGETMESRDRQNCSLLLYVIDSSSRGLISMVEAAFYIAQGFKIVLCIREIPQGAVIWQDKLGPNAIRDYNRSRKYLSDIATKEKVPIFDDISEAVLAAIEILEKQKYSDLTNNVGTLGSRCQLET